MPRLFAVNLSSSTTKNYHWAPYSFAFEILGYQKGALPILPKDSWSDNLINIKKIYYVLDGLFYVFWCILLSKLQVANI